jgi:hypothetical protein
MSFVFPTFYSMMFTLTHFNCSKVKFTNLSAVQQRSLIKLGVPSLDNNCKAGGAIDLSAVQIQIVAMSATMGNVEELAAWIGGSLFQTSFRPVPLIEYLVAGSELLDSYGNVLSVLSGAPGTSKSDCNNHAATPAGKNVKPVVATSKINNEVSMDPDNTVLLTKQGLQQGQQVLIFCPTKYGCLQTCKLLVDDFKRFGKNVGSLSTIPSFIDGNNGKLLRKSSSLASSANRDEVYQPKGGFVAESIPVVTHQKMRSQFYSTIQAMAQFQVKSISSHELSVSQAMPVDHRSASLLAPVSEAAKELSDREALERLLCARKRVVDALLEINPFVEETLKASVLCGVAYHNSGIYFALPVL